MFSLLLLCVWCYYKYIKIFVILYFFSFPVRIIIFTDLVDALANIAPFLLQDGEIGDPHEMADKCLECLEADNKWFILIEDLSSSVAKCDLFQRLWNLPLGRVICTSRLGPDQCGLHARTVDTM